MNVEQYYQEMELAMIRAGVKETSQATVDHFIRGLNPKLASFAEMFNFMEIENLVHTTAKHEADIKRQRYQNHENMSDSVSSKSVSKCTIELDKEKVIESIHFCQNKENENKSVKVTKKKDEKQEHEKIEKTKDEKQDNEKNEKQKDEIFFEKIEVKSDCRDISIITNDLDHSFACIGGELQVVGDLFPKKPPDPFLLPFGSIEPLSLPCQDSRANLFEEGENDSIQRDVQYRVHKAQQSVQRVQQSYHLETLTLRTSWIFAWLMTWMTTCVELNVMHGRAPPKPPWHGGVQWSFKMSNLGPNAMCNGLWEFQNDVTPHSSLNGCHNGPYIFMNENIKRKAHLDNSRSI